MSASTPNLEEFLGGYFHQDWSEDAPTAVAIVERYLSEWPIEEIPKMLNELNALLAQRDDDVMQCVMKMGCFYNPVADGISYRAWLNQIVYRLNIFLREYKSSDLDET